jgi:hypothetical protein
MTSEKKEIKITTWYGPLVMRLLQIHSNTNLNYKFVASLTSQTRQQEQLQLSVKIKRTKELQRQDQARTEVFSGHRHHRNIQAHARLAIGHVIPANRPIEEA